MKSYDALLNGADKMGREPMASTLNTHNSALNHVFDEAVVRG